MFCLVPGIEREEPGNEVGVWPTYSKIKMSLAYQLKVDFARTFKLKCIT